MRSEFDDAVYGLGAKEYLWLPTDDDHAPTLDQLRQGVNFICEIIEGGGKVYVHCAGGVGRAPTMAAAYLVSTGLTPAEALALIRRSRPFINPTKAQLAALEEYASDHKLPTPELTEA
jgi:protein-tyrosine phosphatase